MSCQSLDPNSAAPRPKPAKLSWVLDWKCSTSHPCTRGHLQLTINYWGALPQFTPQLLCPLISFLGTLASLLSLKYHFRVDVCALHWFGDTSNHFPSRLLDLQLTGTLSLHLTSSKNPSSMPNKYLWNDCTNGCVFPSQVCPTPACDTFLKLSRGFCIHPCLISLCWFWPSSPSYVNHLNLNMSCIIWTTPAVGHLDSFYFSSKSLTKMFNKPVPRTEPCGLPPGDSSQERPGSEV